MKTENRINEESDPHALLCRPSTHHNRSGGPLVPPSIPTHSPLSRRHPSPQQIGEIERGVRMADTSPQRQPALCAPLGSLIEMIVQLQVPSHFLLSSIRSFVSIDRSNCRPTDRLTDTTGGGRESHLRSSSSRNCILPIQPQR
eukprot:GHVU01158758.1.p1 GENE.GHVU01158758.1~~GHVU01158758.1.p1  ORF type:complete len:143 (+),score=6.73 GHVU01158758.1:656-1084(+)